MELQHIYIVEMEFASVYCMCFCNTVSADDIRCGLPCMHLSPDVLTLVVPLQLTSVRTVIQLYVVRRGRGGRGRACSNLGNEISCRILECGSLCFLSLWPDHRPIPSNSSASPFQRRAQGCIVPFLSVHYHRFTEFMKTITST